MTNLSSCAACGGAPTRYTRPDRPYCSAACHQRGHVTTTLTRRSPGLSPERAAEKADSVALGFWLMKVAVGLFVAFVGLSVLSIFALRDFGILALGAGLTVALVCLGLGFCGLIFGGFITSGEGAAAAADGMAGTAGWMAKLMTGGARLIRAARAPKGEDA